MTEWTKKKYNEAYNDYMPWIEDKVLGHWGEVCIPLHPLLPSRPCNTPHPTHNPNLTPLLTPPSPLEQNLLHRKRQTLDRRHRRQKPQRNPRRRRRRRRRHALLRRDPRRRGGYVLEGGHEPC